MAKYLETIILITELDGMLIYEYMIFFYFELLWFCYFPKKIGTHLEKQLIYMCKEKKIYSFHTLELMIHFLAAENFFNLDILLNLTTRFWIV